MFLIIIESKILISFFYCKIYFLKKKNFTKDLKSKSHSILLEKSKNEKKFKKMEKERPNEMEVAKEDYESSKEKDSK
jgi:hypothetical protein